MALSVLVPFRPDAAERSRNWDWLKTNYDGEVIVADSPGEWCKPAAVNAAAKRASGDRFAIIDADVLVDPDALRGAAASHRPWVIPHTTLVRFNPAGTEKLLAGADPASLAEQSEHWDEKPYLGRLGGGVVVIDRDAYFAAPMDERFQGWGQEDISFAIALRTLIGKPERLESTLYHLWHEPQPRRTRKYGSRESVQLHRRYLAARGSPEAMRALVNEGATWRSPTS